jgi:sugar phosphate isomerase/epimerase
MIRIGVRAHDYGRDVPGRLFSRIAGDGYSCVQLAMQKAFPGIESLQEITPESVEQAAAAAQRCGLWVAVFGAYADLALPDAGERCKNISVVERCIPFAVQMKAGCIGMETTARTKQKNMTKAEAVDSLLCSLWKLLPKAEEAGVTVAIEPVLGHTVDTPECAAKVLRVLASKSLKVIFDPVNLLSAQELPFQRQLWDRTFDLLAEKITAVHIKGTAPGVQGELQKTDLKHSAVDYGYLFSRLRELPQELAVLREEAVPSLAEQDCIFLKEGLL